MKHITDIFFETEFSKLTSQSQPIPPQQAPFKRKFHDTFCASTPDAYGLLFTDAAHLIQVDHHPNIRARASFP